MGRRMEFRSCIDLLMIWGLMSSAGILGTIHRHSPPPPPRPPTPPKNTTNKKPHTQKHSQNKQTNNNNNKATTTTKQNGKNALHTGKEELDETGTVRSSCWVCGLLPRNLLSRVGTGPHRNRYSTYFVLGLWPTQKLVTSCWDCGPHRNWLPRVGTVAHSETGYLVLGQWSTQKPVQYVLRFRTMTHTETGTARTSCWECGPNRNRCSTYLVLGP